MARTMQGFAAEHPDLAPALMADAIALEKRALNAIAAGVSELLLDDTMPKQKTARTLWREREAAQRKAKVRPATAAMLALARAMQVLAGKDLMDDPDMIRDAIELEKRAHKPTEKDFDDAALAVQAARFQLKALDAIKLVLSEPPEDGKPAE
jgi:predicted NAD/FAD-binding protein